jgi:hypothetical protein
MDEQAEAKTVQRYNPEEEWPKKRTLLIGASTSDDFIRAERTVKRFREDVAKFKQKSGRNHGIAYYNGPGVRCLYVWYTTNQITIHFGD